jgi:hypothetical protein
MEANNGEPNPSTRTPSSKEREYHLSAITGIVGIMATLVASLAGVYVNYKNTSFQQRIHEEQQNSLILETRISNVSLRRNSTANAVFGLVDLELTNVGGRHVDVLWGSTDTQIFKCDHSCEIDDTSSFRHVGFRSEGFNRGGFRAGIHYIEPFVACFSKPGVYLLQVLSKTDIERDLPEGQEIGWLASEYVIVPDSLFDSVRDRAHLPEDCTPCGTSTSATCH